MSNLTGLDWKDFEDVAEILNIDRSGAPSIKAVAEVESPRSAFMTYKGERRPTILFEPHKFYLFTGSRPFSRTHPHLSRRTPLKPGEYGTLTTQWDKYEEAKKLGEEKAAMLSCSWGAFQIMGFNFDKAGFPTVEKFVEAMWESEKRHLEAFANFIASHPRILVALREKNWERFAELYNGPSYKRNNYHINIATEYQTAVREYSYNPHDLPESFTNDQLIFIKTQLDKIEDALKSIRSVIENDGT